MAASTYVLQVMPRCLALCFHRRLGQRFIVDLLTARLDALLPQPLADVLEREERERREVARLLRRLRGGR